MVGSDYLDDDSITFGETGSVDRKRSVLDVGDLMLALCPLAGNERVVAWVPTVWTQAGANGVQSTVAPKDMNKSAPLYIVTVHLTVWETSGRAWAQWVCEGVFKPVPGELRCTLEPRAPYLSRLNTAIDRFCQHMWSGENTDFPIWFPKN
jgi:hypothetical protein